MGRKKKQKGKGKKKEGQKKWRQADFFVDGHEWLVGCWSGRKRLSQTAGWMLFEGGLWILEGGWMVWEVVFLGRAGTAQWLSVGGQTDWTDKRDSS